MKKLLLIAIVLLGMTAQAQLTGYFWDEDNYRLKVNNVAGSRVGDDIMGDYYPVGLGADGRTSFVDEIRARQSRTASSTGDYSVTVMKLANSGNSAGGVFPASTLSDRNPQSTRGMVIEFSANDLDQYHIVLLSYDGTFMEEIAVPNSGRVVKELPSGMYFINTFRNRALLSSPREVTERTAFHGFYIIR